MIEVYRDIKKTKEVETQHFTGIQAVAFAMKTYESLNKNDHTIKYDIDLFGGYMITLMTMYKPNSVQSIATEIFEEHKKKDSETNKE